MILFQQYTKPGLYLPVESRRFSFAIGEEGYFPGQYFSGTDRFITRIK